MSRFARDHRVIFWEEPVTGDSPEATIDVRTCPRTGVIVVTPRLPDPALTEVGGIVSRPDQDAILKTLLEIFLAGQKGPLVRWYYTPMMLPFSRHIDAACTVYDCMDELANFNFAPPQLLELERELFDAADVVFTGGYSLYEAKKNRHPNIHPFPSSVDRAHFAQARGVDAQPDDQAPIHRPRFGFFGVVDERMDLSLLAALADAHPEWSIVVVGPVVKIEPADLPVRANLHYLGSKSYAELPVYLGGWDVALMPFAINESTRFISPTKTPEYLAGGKPVVSTPVKDVVRHYGHLLGVQIAGDAESFVAACDKALALAKEEDDDWLAEADLLLSATSWDTTQARMAGLVDEALGVRVDGKVPALLVAAE